MNTIFDYYLPLYLHIRTTEIPDDVSVYIFSFVKEDFRKIIQFQELVQEIKRTNPIHKRIMRDFYMNVL